MFVAFETRCSLFTFSWKDCCGLVGSQVLLLAYTACMRYCAIDLSLVK